MGTIRCKIGGGRADGIGSVSHQHVEPARAGTVSGQFSGQLADVKVTGRVPMHVLPRYWMKRGPWPGNRYRRIIRGGLMTGTDEYTRVGYVVLLHKIPLVDSDSSHITRASCCRTDFRIPPSWRAVYVSPRSGRKPAIEIVRIRQHSQADLVQVAEANGAPSLFPRFIEGGQEHRGENANNGDDDKEFDQRECGRSCRSSTKNDAWASLHTVSQTSVKCHVIELITNQQRSKVKTLYFNFVTASIADNSW